MKRIRIVSGAYGHKPPGARLIDTKTRASEPFDIDAAEAARLVGLGVAAYVDAPPDAEETTLAPGEKPEYSVDMTAKQLQALMTAAGIPFKNSTAKAVLVAALDAYYAPQDDTEGDGEEGKDSGNGEGALDLNANDPVT